MAKLGTVWERATEFAGDRLGLLAPLVLGAIVLPAAASAGLQLFAVTAPPAIRAAAMALVLLLSVPTLWASLTITAFAIEPESFAAARSRASRRLLPVLGVSIVLGAALALSMLPVPVLLAARGYGVAQLLGGSATQITVDAQTASMVALYVLVLIPVVITLLVRLILVTPVVLREPMLLGAVRRSWVLTRRHGWRTFGTLLLFFVIAGVAQLAVQTVFGSVFVLLFGAGTGITLAAGLTVLVQALLQAVIVVLLAAFQGKLYAALTTAPVWPA